MAKVPTFASVDPFNGMTSEDPGTLQSLMGGRWTEHNHGCTQYQGCQQHCSRNFGRHYVPPGYSHVGLPIKKLTFSEHMSKILK